MFMFFGVSQIELFLQLLLAAFLGGLIGLEREYKRKEAGLRTFALVSLGACLFTLTAFYFSTNGAILNSRVQIDPSRVIQAVAIGIGFLGAGLIILRKSHVEGLTTAAGLWVAAAVGIAVGSGLYFLAVFVTFLAIGILAGLRLIEEKVFHKFPESE